MSKITVLNNQTLLDVSVQEYGTVEGLITLALANDLSITQNISPGQILQVPEFESKEVEIYNYYQKNSLKPATQRTPVEGDESEVILKELAIGNMIIGTDFKVFKSNNNLR